MRSLSTSKAPLGLGIGLDMPWTANGVGFREGPHGHLPSSLVKFFDVHRHLFSYSFIAFQPRGMREFKPHYYFSAYDEFFQVFENGRRLPRVLHQTILNMGTTAFYDHEAVAIFTNALIRRYGISWVLEDLGIWSIEGKVLPYPLPPIMTELGLRACISNIQKYMRLLDAPLSVEFPGYSEGLSFFIGELNAFDYFRHVVEGTGCAVTLDIGHLLSYQWLIGRQGTEYLTDYERLPLSCCHEIHLSGCKIMNGKFRDLHHGIILDEQIDLLAFLVPKCANLRAITYEDPRFEASGQVVVKAQKNFNRLVNFANAWVRGQSVSDRAHRAEGL